MPHRQSFVVFGQLLQLQQLRSEEDGGRGEEMADDRFSVVDYVVFSIMLLISALIGIWHAFMGGKQKTTAEYLLANRTMSCFPVSISILVSFLSAITLLGLPAEIYTYGTQFYLSVIGYVILCAIVSTVFIPMYRRINITCVNEVRAAPNSRKFSFRPYKCHLVQRARVLR